jgi:filamentous hemagglutinin
MALLPKSPLDLALMVGTDGIGDVAEAGIKLFRGAEETYKVYRTTEEGETTYVGIARRTLAERGAEHGKQLEEIAGGLSKKQARGAEHALIEHHGLVKNGGTLTDRINSISRTANPTFYNEAVTFGRQLLQSLSYLPVP